MTERVERHILDTSNPSFSLLDSFCFLSKNLYNHANYLIRREFIQNGKWLSYSAIDKILKTDTDYPDYRAMPTAQSAQQTLRLLEKNWKSFFSAIKDWKLCPEKYLGRPKLPRYRAKDGRFVLILTNQNCKLKDSRIVFPKVFQGFEIATKIKGKFQQVRIIPHKDYLVLEVVYKVRIAPEVADNGRHLGIDIGVDNLAAVANNFGERPILFNGRGLKSINQFYNWKLSHYRSVAEKMNGAKSTRRLRQLTRKRNEKVRDLMHKTSRKIIRYAVERNVSVIIIGKNKGWKQKSDMGKRNNQNFVQIPFAMLIQQIQYKAEECGVRVILTEESYTSGTSVLDREAPVKESYNRARRIRRGLFRSNVGVTVNADVNAACQVMKKVFPNEFSDGIEGVVLRPIRVDVA